MLFKKSKLIQICMIFFISFLAVSFSTTLYAKETKVETKEIKIGQKAEWEHPKKILMHTPGDEIFMGVIHPRLECCI